MAKGKWPQEYDALWFPRCGSVHTFFTFLNPDLLFLDSDYKVLSLHTQAPPWRLWWGPKGSYGCLEIPPGETGRRGWRVGSSLKSHIQGDRYGADSQNSPGERGDKDTKKNSSLTEDAPAGNPASRGVIRWLALGAFVGPILFNAAWLILGFLRPGYSPVRQTLSALGVGPNGVFLNAFSVLAGLMLIVGVFAVFQGFKREMGTVASRVCAGIFLVLPSGILLNGFFDMNSSYHTPGAAAALVTSMMTFPAAGFMLRRIPRWRWLGTGLVISGPLTFFLLYGFTGSVFPSKMAINVGISGLWQRAVIIELLAWHMALGWTGFRRLPLVKPAGLPVG